MESEERQKQEGLTMPWQAPDSLLPGVLARLEQRRNAVREHSLDALRTQLAHTQWEVRAAAVRALAECEAETAEDGNEIRELMSLALEDEHRLVRVAAVRALLQYPLTDRGNKASPTLPPVSPDLDNYNKTTPDRSTGFVLGPDVLLDKLLPGLRDPDWEVREMTVLVLGELHDQRLDPLQALLQVAQEDTHSSVREAATYALHTYRSQDEKHNTSIAQEKGYRHPLSLCTRYLSIFVRQVPLIHKSVWFVSPALLILWFIQYAYFVSGAGRNIHDAGLYLALFATISAGAGSAFIYGAERDAAFELTLSTPTSIRILMLCRFVLIAGYNILLAGVASVAIVLLYRGSLWDVMQLWLGPVLLISSLSLMLSTMLGSLLAMFVTFLLEASQSFALGMFGHTPMLEFSFSTNWQTSPMILLLAVFALVGALLYAPRQPRLVSV